VYFHRVTIQLQLINISYHISYEVLTAMLMWILVFFVVYCTTLKMEAASFAETLVFIYQCTVHDVSRLMF